MIIICDSLATQVNHSCYFNDPVDFLTNSSDHAESTDFIPQQPVNENPETPTLNYQQGDKTSWYIISIVYSPSFYSMKHKQLVNSSETADAF